MLQSGNACWSFFTPASVICGLLRIMSVFDLAVRQCLLEFLHAFVGDPRAPQGQALELAEARQVFQADIRDSGVIKHQPLESKQPREVCQPGIPDLGAGRFRL